QGGMKKWRGDNLTRLPGPSANGAGAKARSCSTRRRASWSNKTGRSTSPRASGAWTSTASAPPAGSGPDSATSTSGSRSRRGVHQENHDVRTGQLDAGPGTGPALQALIGPRGPYRHVTSRTPGIDFDECGPYFGTRGG